MKEKNMDNQEVSAALDLLKETLEDERKRIFGVGSEAMGAQDAQTAHAVLELARKFDGYTEEVRILAEKWKDLLKSREALSGAVRKVAACEGTLFGLKSRTAPAGGYTRKKFSPRGKKTNFCVLFSDGVLIQEDTAADTLAHAIEKIGPVRVAALGVRVNGEPLVSREESRKYKSMREISGGYKVITHCSTRDKMRLLETISKLLKLKLKLVLLSPKAEGTVPEAV